MQSVHRQRRRQAEVILQSAKVGGDQLLQRGPLQQVVGALEGVLPVLRQVEGEDRLVDLHPLDALRRQTVEHLAVDRQEPFEQLELVERLALGLAQPEIGQRADQHRLDRIAERQRFFDFLEQLRPRQLELLFGAELRHQVVIVGIEPLGHLLGLAATAAAVRHATGHGEQRVQRRLAIGRAEALRHHAEH